LAAHCLDRLRHQVADRITEPSAIQIKAIALDPRVKFATLREYRDKQQKVVLELKTEHQEIYVKMHQSTDQPSVAHSQVAAAGVQESQGFSLQHADDVVFAPRPRQNYDSSALTQDYLIAKADEIWEAWVSYAVSWEHFTAADVLLAGRTDAYDIWKLYKSANVLQWYAKEGAQSFPSVAVLARVYLAKPMSNAFQERFFSTAGYVLSNKRTSLDPDRAEKLQLLMHASK